MPGGYAELNTASRVRLQGSSHVVLRLNFCGNDIAVERYIIETVFRISVEMNDYVVTNATVWKNFLWRRHSQTCTPIQQSLPDKVDLLQVQIIFSVLYFLVWIVAVSGNSLVLYIVTVKQVNTAFWPLISASCALNDRQFLPPSN